MADGVFAPGTPQATGTADNHIGPVLVQVVLDRRLLELGLEPLFDVPVPFTTYSLQPQRITRLLQDIGQGGDTVALDVDTAYPPARRFLGNGAHQAVNPSVGEVAALATQPAGFVLHHRQFQRRAALGQLLQGLE
ncbi:hypothetical protein D3C85_594830 [compost metagenome]